MVITTFHLKLKDGRSSSLYVCANASLGSPAHNKKIATLMLEYLFTLCNRMLTVTQCGEGVEYLTCMRANENALRLLFRAAFSAIFSPQLGIMNNSQFRRLLLSGQPKQQDGDRQSASSAPRTPGGALGARKHSSIPMTP